MAGDRPHRRQRTILPAAKIARDLCLPNQTPRRKSSASSPFAPLKKRVRRQCSRQNSVIEHLTDMERASRRQSRSRYTLAYGTTVKVSLTSWLLLVSLIPAFAQTDLPHFLAAESALAPPAAAAAVSQSEDSARPAPFGSRGVHVHDPSTIVKCKDQFWVFYTGRGIPSFHSQDLLTWDPGPCLFTNPPSWIRDVLPAHRGTYFWAPDVIQNGARYLLYYSVSTFGKNTSAIGLATNPTLDPSDLVTAGPTPVSSCAPALTTPLTPSTPRSPRMLLAACGLPSVRIGVGSSSSSLTRQPACAWPRTHPFIPSPGTLPSKQPSSFIMSLITIFSSTGGFAAAAPIAPTRFA